MHNVLFVCLGNICRSPAAEGILKTMIRKASLENRIFVDSCGTTAHHAGEEADLRMFVHAEKRGYDVDSIARGFENPVDFEKFDLIIAMDNQNFADLQQLTQGNGQYNKKIHRFVSFCQGTEAVEVEDPFYGGPKDFESALDLIENGCRHLMDSLRQRVEPKDYSPASK